MVDLKELSEGQTVGGVYSLEHSIRSDESGSFFAAFGAQGERVLLKLAVESPDAEQQLAVWQRSRHLKHEHLLQLRDCGRTYAAGGSFVYGVFEYPDDVVASALAQGPLSEDETRGVVSAALSALRYLHGEGLVHSAVDAYHVVAVGDSVKLATDSLHEASVADTALADFRQLARLARSLRVPEPVEASLLAEVEGEMAPPAEADLARLAPPARHRDLEPAPSKPFPKWILFGVAALLLTILIFNLRRKPEPVRPATSVIPDRIERVAPPPPAPAPVAETVQGAWRVIAFTYGSRDAAAKKVTQVNRRWPSMNASVFVPKDNSGYYLVALGGRMKREDAARLQRKARSLGLPRDTYLQNYSE
jgi:eukaryotic-like serine/threonine-protein kinase